MQRQEINHPGVWDCGGLCKALSLGHNIVATINFLFRSGISTGGRKVAQCFEADGGCGSKINTAQRW